MKQEKITRRTAFQAILTLALFFLVILGTSPYAYAANKSQIYMDSMADKTWYWYLFFRNNIIFPLLTISFASLGFQLIFLSPLGANPRVLEKLYMKLKSSVAATILVFLLPFLITTGLNVVKGSAWKPPTYGLDRIKEILGITETVTEVTEATGSGTGVFDEITFTDPTEAGD